MNIYERRSSVLGIEFDRYMREHPEFCKKIPNNAHIVLLLEGDKEFNVELFYNHYQKTPVTEKYLCVVVKTLKDDQFIITAYFTDTIKKGEILWRKK